MQTNQLVITSYVTYYVADVSLQHQQRSNQIVVEISNSGVKSIAEEIIN